MSRLIFTMLIAAIAITSTDLPVLASPSGATAMTQMPASASSDKKRDNKHNKKHDKDRDRGHRNDHGRKPHDRRPGQPTPRRITPIHARDTRGIMTDASNGTDARRRNTDAKQPTADAVPTASSAKPNITHARPTATPIFTNTDAPALRDAKPTRQCTAITI